VASAKYFRRQAETCLKLAATADSPEIRGRLLALAEEYKDKAEQAEALEPKAPPDQDQAP